MGFRKVMGKEIFHTYCLLSGMYDTLRRDMPKFISDFVLTKAEKENWFAASKHITDLTESITKRLDTKYLQSIIPILSNIEVFAMTKPEAERKKREASNGCIVEITKTEWDSILEIVFDCKCNGCSNKNWKKCPSRALFLKLEVPTMDEVGKGFCPYKVGGEE